MAETTGHAVAFAFPEIEASEIRRPEAGRGGPSPVEQALEEADAIREAARQDGFAAGQAEAAATVSAAVAALRAAAEEISALRGGMADAVEEAAVDLALRITDQLLQGALEAHPELVVDVVRGALRRLVERERVTVLVHPDDLDAVRAAAPDLIAQLGGIEHLEVQAERRLSRGGAAVRTQEGEVDATLETKLARVRELLAERAATHDDDLHAPGGHDPEGAGPGAEAAWATDAALPADADAPSDGRDGDSYVDGTADDVLDPVESIPGDVSSAVDVPADDLHGAAATLDTLHRDPDA